MTNLNESTLNIVPFGIKGDKKGEIFPKWKEYQQKKCDLKRDNNSNLGLITGKIPDTNLQVVALDFDGIFENIDIFNIKIKLRKINEILGSYHLLNYSGNKGLHFIYICDCNQIIMNRGDSWVIKKNLFPDNVKGIHIRGRGGFLYFPPTKFIDSIQEYMILESHYERNVISSFHLNISIDKIFQKSNERKKRKIKSMLESQKELEKDINAIFSKEISSMRLPLRQLISKGALDIEEISRITCQKEFLYWLSLWLEVFYNKIDMNIVIRLLKKYQPSFDYKETMYQIRYIREDQKPFTNEKLMELFPYWKPKQREKYKGFL